MTEKITRTLLLWIHDVSLKIEDSKNADYFFLSVDHSPYRITYARDN